MNSKQKKILIVFIALLLIVGLYFGYSIITKRNNNRASENKDTLLMNKKYKNIYAFKFINDSIYALKDNEEDSLLVNYKEEICGTETCGELDYEFKDGKLYLYYIGNQAQYDYKHYQKSITVYSIDFTKNDTSLKKEYVISKDDGYVTNVKQNDSSIFFDSYVWDGYTLEKNHKLYQFSKDSGELKEIYDLNDYLPLHKIMVNNNKIYMVCANKNGQSGDFMFEMNLDDYSTQKLIGSDTFSTYDTISNKILTHINDRRTIQITDIKDNSKKEINEKISIDNIFYSINDVLIYYVPALKTVKIRGNKNFNIDLNKYVKEDMSDLYDLYNGIILADDHSVVALVYIESGKIITTPTKIRINFLTGEVTNEGTEVEYSSNDKYLYIK